MVTAIVALPTEEEQELIFATWNYIDNHDEHVSLARHRKLTSLVALVHAKHKHEPGFGQKVSETPLTPTGEGSSSAAAGADDGSGCAMRV